ncbi:malonyl-CoA:anthocyanidin 5-O-glucoside-6''-O-malonyltransferase-like [Dioscorea cayenensis subsp. rotundata]|uniref:Malonyl-CoA:anthocyanidin 5-O-glucoside-6''-O-malonyltransferase-like n=1 Tax=Dioscorea cayennensis subsp. rotundata TaxID=55577 RepID=A0AB40B8K5_DIOCR|nr:malonyl-CoA:anthocyanidin 5-O-glucoside-6''-O-malonyltransferase-like [Dioscorea cayenensis subsp. rotundata]
MEIELENFSFRIHNVSYITISPSPALGKDALLLLPLSFFDAIWISVPPIQRLLLFPGATPDLHSLKSSLSTSLRCFYSLAGKLTYLPATGDIAVACSPDDHIVKYWLDILFRASSHATHITFIEANSDGDFIRLASDEIHDVDSFLWLVPELDTRVLPAPVMAVQVTKFESGGFAVGVAVHHAVVDGRGLWQFIKAWATACREAEESISEVSTMVHDRTVIRHHPRGDEIARQFLKMMAPDLPILPSRKCKGWKSLLIQSRGVWSFLSPGGKRSAAPNVLGLLPGVFFSLMSCSFFWFLPLLVDFVFACVLLGLCSAFFAVILLAYSLLAKVMELVENAGLSKACSRIKEQIDESFKDVLGWCEDWGARVGRSWTEIVSMNHEGQVVLVGGRKQGEIQMSVCLSSHMEKFTIEFSRELCV